MIVNMVPPRKPRNGVFCILYLWPSDPIVSRSCGVITPLFGVVQVTVKFAAFTIPQESTVAVVSIEFVDGIVIEGGSALTNTSEIN